MAEHSMLCFGSLMLSKFKIITQYGSHTERCSSGAFLLKLLQYAPPDTKCLSKGKMVAIYSKKQLTISRLTDIMLMERRCDK